VESVVSQYRHEALSYAGREGFVSSCASIAHEALDAGERVLVLAAQDKLDDVRDVIGAAGEDVTFVATDQRGRNPCRRTTTLHSFLDGADGRHSTGLQESVLTSRSPAGREEAAFVEHMLNHETLGTWPLAVICLFDSDAMDDDAGLAMRQSHPVLRGSDANPDYLPSAAQSIFGTLPGRPPAGARTFAASTDRLAGGRAFVRSSALGQGLSPDRVDDLVLAANEVITNSIRHAGGRADLAMWRENGTLVCEVRDQGHLADAMAGRLAPAPSATTGRGLWLVNELCDLVQIRSAESGTVVRMYVDV
jgi:anti-sigma regulatory factor (Ser/Thr protein kinase)